MQLRKATRQQVKLRLGLSAPSGFGKTYSALLLAYGITGDWEKIAVIDTEHGSAELYCHLGAYNVLPLDPPYSPERYIEAIQACEQAGMELIIVDSISHEWEGEGGVIDLADQLGGQFQSAWKNLTPRHEKFKQAITYSKCHTITTVRRKQDYILQEKVNNSGKTVQTPVKAGFKEITRDGWEYELTVNFELIDDRHYTRASKDRTGMFVHEAPFIITAETGKQLKAWAESGKDHKTMLLEEVEACTDVACTKALYAKHPTLQKEDWFKSAIIDKGTALKEAEMQLSDEAEAKAAQTPAETENVQPAQDTKAKTSTREELLVKFTKTINNPLINQSEKRARMLKLPKLSESEIETEIEVLESAIANRQKEQPQTVYRNETEVA